MEIKSYLHHILPPFSILVVVVSVVQVDICLLQVDTARAAGLSDLTAILPDLAVGAAHVDQPEDGEGDWNRYQDVVYDRSKVQAGFFVGGSRFFFGGSRFKRLELVQLMGMNQQ